LLNSSGQAFITPSLPFGVCRKPNPLLKKNERSEQLRGKEQQQGAEAVAEAKSQPGKSQGQAISPPAGASYNEHLRATAWNAGPAIAGRERL